MSPSGNLEEEDILSPFTVAIDSGNNSEDDAVSDIIIMVSMYLVCHRKYQTL